MNPEGKNFKIPRNQIKQLIAPMGGCFATDRITVDGMKVGYMYREESESDSGWRFFAGDESDDYANNPRNLEIYDVNTICNYDPAIIPFLHSPEGSAFGRVAGTDEFLAE